MVHGKPCSYRKAYEEPQISHIAPNTITPWNKKSPDIGVSISRLETKLETRFQLLYEVIQNISPSAKRRLDGHCFDEEHLRSPRKKPCRAPLLIPNLRRFLNNNEAQFKSKEQEMAVVHSCNSTDDALVVLSTGAGKSLVFMLPAYIQKEKVSIVIVPLLALQQDLIKRCEDAGLQACLWNAKDVAGTLVVVVSAEHLSSAKYVAFVRQLYATNKIHAIFVDEAHLVLLWQTFRESLRNIRNFIRPESVQVPVIALTATAPPAIEKEIAFSCGLSRFKIIRQETSRCNIRYQVKDVSSRFLYRKVDEALHSFRKDFSSPSWRAITFVQAREDCETLCTMLNALSPDVPCFKYHAGMDAGERIQMQRKWEDASDGLPHVMVATRAFGCGIDISTVRVVVHAGIPNTLTDFIQESGRAGRDGKCSISLVLNVTDAKRYSACTDTELSHFGSVDMLREDNSECRRWLLDSFIDGVSHDGSCLQRGMEPCDNCSLSTTTGANPTKQVRSSSYGNHKNRIYGPGWGLNIASDNSSFPVYDTQSLPEGREIRKTTRSSSASCTSATPQEIRCGYSPRITKFYCPICSVSKAALIEHKRTDNEKSWPCYRNRCLRCAQEGHSVNNCSMFKSVQGACRSCGVRMFLGSMVHPNGTYGQKCCPIKKIICTAHLVWADPQKRMKLVDSFPELSEIDTVEDFDAWIRGNQKAYARNCADFSTPGFSLIAPWIFTNVLGLKV